MNQDRLAGIWRELVGDVKIGWGRLTGDPLAIADGLDDQRAGRIRQRHGISKETVALQLRDFHERNRNWDLSNR